MFKKTAIALTLFSLSLTAVAADWQVGGGFGQLSDSSDGDDISLNFIYGSVAYKIENSAKNFYLMPELRLGTGVGDDSLYGAKIKVESLLALSLRGQYDFNNRAYVYVMPSYANLDLKASYRGESASDDSWEFGIGAGVGYSLNKKVSVEASYETYDGTKLLSVGFKYAF
ncbi:MULTISPECIES: outer membrane beta-barrel protein [unclassified Colwellia]|jgi:opacity protein-like surface antigen|uniref:outer membrane beta-barrel protein n=1 Tax=unclassified Colwellia TaxID=196834 RepID=UPI0015F5A805|nr:MULTISPECIES: outer membrane beta-barrel protein [unclassified Colwellia]MBA6252948.1 outer membrane beta-barrel protein [Colwellia sp. MB3u-55]MBA6397329.1 outer membrane beta-barrel protein [Colwellia sp. BRX10-4]